MRKLVVLLLAFVLCFSLAISAFATTVKSNQGGNNGGQTTAPRTGSCAVAVLALTACTAGGVGAAAYRKSKE